MATTDIRGRDNTDVVTTLGHNHDGISLVELYGIVRPHIVKIVALSLTAGVIAYGLAHLIPPTYTARASIIAPQQQQNTAAAALASLGALAGLSG
jgi:capsular polysaccharide biosynthesis protein